MDCARRGHGPGRAGKPPTVACNVLNLHTRNNAASAAFSRLLPPEPLCQNAGMRSFAGGAAAG
eukprot:3700766-Lingulodinium_polyedra.AAC.1